MLGNCKRVKSEKQNKPIEKSPVAVAAGLLKFKTVRGKRIFIGTGNK
jgi:hypothetical protein